MKIPFILLFTLITLISCSSDSKKEESETISITNQPASCLNELVENNEIEKMIQLEQVSDIVQVAVVEIEVEENKSKSSKYSTVRYLWEPAQKRTVDMEIKAGDRTINQTVPVKSGFNVGNIEILKVKEDRTPLEYFDMLYGPKTTEEKEQMKKGVDKARSESDKVDEKSSEMIKSMVDKQNSSPVDGVGNRAFGSTKNVNGMGFYTLRVLHGGTKFEVSTDVSDDPEEDERIAKEVAIQIIQNCD